MIELTLNIQAVDPAGLNSELKAAFPSLDFGLSTGSFGDDFYEDKHNVKVLLPDDFKAQEQVKTVVAAHDASKYAMLPQLAPETEQLLARLNVIEAKLGLPLTTAQSLADDADTSGVIALEKRV